MRLEVVLHSLRSARAGSADEANSTRAAQVAGKRQVRAPEGSQLFLALHSSIDQYDPEVVDIGVSGPAHDQSASQFEEAGGIVIVQKFRGVEVAQAR